MILGSRSNRSTRHVTCRCSMCSRDFVLTQRQLDARLQRYGMVRCPTCGCVLEARA